MKNYTIEDFASQIGDIIEMSESSYLSITDGAIEYDNCIANFNLDGHLYANSNGFWSIDYIRVTNCYLQFEDSETHFTETETAELTRLVNLYF